jgi:hypothetical protein
MLVGADVALRSDLSGLESVQFSRAGRDQPPGFYRHRNGRGCSAGQRRSGAYVTADSPGRTQSPAVVAFLKQAGCDAVDFQLKDKGILGNGHFMMLESNRRQVFDTIRAWLEEKLPAKA